MGFRSTFTTQDYNIAWPQWFIDKYARDVWFADDAKGAIHSRHEGKTHILWCDLLPDIQRAIDWDGRIKRFVVLFLHECGGATRCKIDKVSIVLSEPDDWHKTEGFEHNNCSGCLAA